MSTRETLAEVSLNTLQARDSNRGHRKYVSYDAQAHSRLQLSDFELVKKIGQGGFGEVYVCRKRDTREVLALKIVKKSVIWKKNKVTQMKNERDVLASNLTSWMVQLAYSFQDPQHCYLAMEYCPGGDLRHLLAALGYLEEEEAKIYIAEMILAVHSLHQLGYIHRDLKPDNFLIDSSGHLKLTDFGLSKDGLHSNMSLNNRKRSRDVPVNVTSQHGNSILPAPSISASMATEQTHSSLKSPTAPKTTNHETFNITPLRPSNADPLPSQPTPLYEPSTTSSTKSSTKPEANASTQNEALAYSVVGSPNYMSPEVLSGEHGYGAEVDWWSLGCIFFELVVGNPPFVGDTPQAVFDDILDWKNTLPTVIDAYKDSMSSDCLDFILRFLCEPKERFNSKNGLKRIFAHPFFRDFPIESIFEMDPPFVPNLREECDTTYFDNATRDENQENDVFSRVFATGPPRSPPLGDEFSTATTAAIQCPQTAPRSLVHRRRPDSTDSEGLAFFGTSGTPQVGSYGRFGRLRGVFGGHGHGGIAGSYTPTRMKSPSREIAGFTFQRKRNPKTAREITSAAMKLDFDTSSDESSSIMSHDSSASDLVATGSPYGFDSSVSGVPIHVSDQDRSSARVADALSHLEIVPKALVFGDDKAN